MEFTGRSIVHLVVLAYVVQITCSQHWSYGWLPGGKRSISDLEVTAEVCFGKNYKIHRFNGTMCELYFSCDIS
ncbi:GON3 protein, partial [Atractosteus spatula]|nr:GON3 protein [Atractosteus spatula]